MERARIRVRRAGREELSRRELKRSQEALRNEGNFVSAILNAAVPEEIAGVKASSRKRIA